MELTQQFRGEVLRSVQANGLAVMDQNTAPGQALPRHCHDHAWFTVLFAGEYVEKLPAGERYCSAGMVIWHPPGLLHENVFLSHTHNLNVAFTPEWAALFGTEAPLPSVARSWKGGVAYGLGLELYRALNLDGKIAEDAVMNMVGLCLSPEPGEAASPWLRRVLDWMNDEYSSSLSLLKAAKVAGVHPVHVSRSFRQHLDCTFREYLSLIRLRRATGLLRGSSNDITEIAHATGFCDHAHFTRTFKSATGLTPAAYRALKG